MDAREFLERGRRLNLQIISHRAIIDQLHALADGTPGANLDEPPSKPSGGGKTAPFVKWVYKAIEWEKKVDGEMSDLIGIQQEIADAVSAIGDPSLQTVLILRYVSCEPWGEVAKRMSFSMSHVYRLHDRAVYELQRSMDANSVADEGK